MAKTMYILDARFPMETTADMVSKSSVGQMAFLTDAAYKLSAAIERFSVDGSALSKIRMFAHEYDQHPNGAKAYNTPSFGGIRIHNSEDRWGSFATDDTGRITVRAHSDASPLPYRYEFFGSEASGSAGLRVILSYGTTAGYGQISEKGVDAYAHSGGIVSWARILKNGMAFGERGNGVTSGVDLDLTNGLKIAAERDLYGFKIGGSWHSFRNKCRYDDLNYFDSTEDRAFATVKWVRESIGAISGFDGTPNKIIYTNDLGELTAGLAAPDYIPDSGHGGMFSVQLRDGIGITADGTDGSRKVELTSRAAGTDHYRSSRIVSREGVVEIDAGVGAFDPTGGYHPRIRMQGFASTDPYNEVTLALYGGRRTARYAPATSLCFSRTTIKSYSSGETRITADDGVVINGSIQMLNNEGAPVFQSYLNGTRWRIRVDAAEFTTHASEGDMVGTSVVPLWILERGRITMMNPWSEATIVAETNNAQFFYGTNGQFGWYAGAPSKNAFRYIPFEDQIPDIVHGRIVSTAGPATVMSFVLEPKHTGLKKIFVGGLIVTVIGAANDAKIVSVERYSEGGDLVNIGIKTDGGNVRFEAQIFSPAQLTIEYPASDWISRGHEDLLSWDPFTAGYMVPPRPGRYTVASSGSVGPLLPRNSTPSNSAGIAPLLVAQAVSADHAVPLGQLQSMIGSSSGYETVYWADNSNLSTNFILAPFLGTGGWSTPMGVPVSSKNLRKAKWVIRELVTNGVGTSLSVTFRIVPCGRTSPINSSSGTAVKTIIISLPNTGGVTTYNVCGEESFADIPISTGNVLVAVITGFTAQSASGMILSAEVA